MLDIDYTPNFDSELLAREIGSICDEKHDSSGYGSDRVTLISPLTGKPVLRWYSVNTSMIFELPRVIYVRTEYESIVWQETMRLTSYAVSAEAAVEILRALHTSVVR